MRNQQTNASETLDLSDGALKKIFESVAAGRLSPDDALARYREKKAEAVGEFAVLDIDRANRTGFPEVIFGQGKSDDQIVTLFRRLRAKNRCVMATRIAADVYGRIQCELPETEYDPLAKILYIRDPEKPLRPGITVVTAGTADLPVAAEAALTAELIGNDVLRIQDVGVSGIHRLFNRLDEIRASRVIVVAAGMEGALASVVGGLVSCPVIALPTSVGYGASFHGLAALLTMLNACANGIAVVNIDNGFGAGYLAAKINAMGCDGG